MTSEEREKLIEAICGAMRPENDSYERFYDAILYGTKGLTEMSDGELLREAQEWATQPHEEHDDHEPEAILAALLDEIEAKEEEPN